jgi:hypothetical protein
LAGLVLAHFVGLAAHVGDMVREVGMSSAQVGSRGGEGAQELGRIAVAERGLAG